jgi:hypothetical protein
MPENIFYRTDYPDYLKNELYYRFNDGTATPNPTHIAMNVYSYNENTKDFDFLSAVFGDPSIVESNNVIPANIKSWQLTKHGTVSTGLADYSEPAPLGGIEPETPTITNVNIDIGGRIGQIAKANITITTTGLENLKILNNSITLIGSRIELFCRKTWPSPKTYDDEANRIKFTGRLYNFTFEKGDKGLFNVKLDLIGLAEALSNINALPIINPDMSGGWPSGWKKKYRIKDAEEEIPVNNLLILLESIWDREGKLDGSTTQWHEPVPGVAKLDDNIKPSIYVGKRPDNRVTEDDNNAELQFYINLEGLRAIVMKTIELAAAVTNNKQAAKLKILYPQDDNKKYITKGSCPQEFLNSADPERVLLFNTEIKDDGWIWDDVYYKAPADLKDRYPVESLIGNIANIYISRNTIYDILGADLNSTKFKSPGAKSIKSFFNAVFAEIKKETGNWIDLALIPDFDQESTDGILYIVDKSFVQNNASEPILQFALYPQNTRHYPDATGNNISLSAKVPASLASKAFIKDANLTAAEDPVASPDDESDSTELTGDAAIDRINALQQDIATSDTIEEDNNTRRELMAKLKKEGITGKGEKPAGETLIEASKTQNIQTTLDMSITSYGINGWKWGHAIALDFIPSTAPENTVFSVNKIVHTISNDKTAAINSKWETKIECLARLRPKSEASHVTRIGVQTSTNGTAQARPPGYIDTQTALQTTLQIFAATDPFLNTLLRSDPPPAPGPFDQSQLYGDGS